MAKGKQGQKVIDASVAITLANTQYSYVFPAGTTQLEFQCRTAVDIRFATTSGLVATPTGAYQTLKSGSVKVVTELDLRNAVTYYFAAASGSLVVEIQYWTW